MESNVLRLQNESKHSCSQRSGRRRSLELFCALMMKICCYLRQNKRMAWNYLNNMRQFNQAININWLNFSPAKKYYWNITFLWTLLSVIGGRRALSPLYHTLSAKSSCVCLFYVELRCDMRECLKLLGKKIAFEMLTILFSSFSLCDPPLKVTPRVDEHSSV